MKIIFLITYSLFFLSCSEKKEPSREEEVDLDYGFFHGYFRGGFEAGVKFGGGYLKNEHYQRDKIIKTIQEVPLYHFRFSYTFGSNMSIPPDQIGNTTILDVVLSDPDVGKEYQLSTNSGFGDEPRQGLCLLFSKRVPDPWASWLVPEVESIMYAPVSEKPIRLTVNKMELTSVHKAQIVEGRIWLGWIFNTKDPTDSVEIHADFRTAMYR